MEFLYQFPTLEGAVNLQRGEHVPTLPHVSIETIQIVWRSSIMPQWWSSPSLALVYSWYFHASGVDNVR